MRQVSFFVLASLLVAVAMGSMFVPSMEPSPPNPGGGGQDGVEVLVRELARAVMQRDFVKLNDLIEDNATIWDTGFSCGPIDKQTFIQLINATEAASQFINILDNTVSGGIGVFHYEDGFIFKANSSYANYTFDQQRQIIGAEASADGKKLSLIRKISDGTNRQANASAMMDVWWTWANATVNSDAEAISGVLNETVYYATYPPHAKEPFVANRTEILRGIAMEKERRLFLKLSYDFVYPSCNMVVALVATFDAMNNGRRFANKGFVALHLDSNNKVWLMDSFPLFYQ